MECQNVTLIGCLLEGVAAAEGLAELSFDLSDPPAVLPFCPHADNRIMVHTVIMAMDAVFRFRLICVNSPLLFLFISKFDREQRHTIYRI